MQKLFFILCFSCTLSLCAEVKALAFAGSARKESYNKKLVQQAAAMARQLGAEVAVVDLKDYPMPIYDADFEEEGMPDSVKRFRGLMIASNVVIIACPQYNASIPPLLKNTLDWASRSENGKASKEAFKGKKFGIMSASPGKKGGAKALIHLRTIIEDCGGTVIEQQVSVGNADKAFDAQGELNNVATKEELVQEISALLHN